MEREAAPKRPTPYIPLAGLWLCAGLLLVSLFMLGDHVFAWLKWGQYPVYEARDMFSDIGLPYPFQNWVGLQRIIDWIMRSSAAGFLFWLALGVGLISGNALEKHDRMYR